MANIIWHGKRVHKEVLDEAERRLDAAAEVLRGVIVKNISGASPPRSKPGKFPHADRGRLRLSIFWDRPKKLVRRIGTTVKHGLFLEIGTRFMDPRPWLRRTLNEQSRRVSKIITGK